MDEFERKLQGKFKALKAHDGHLTPEFTMLDLVAMPKQKTTFINFAPWGGAIAACVAVVFFLVLTNSKMQTQDMWLVAELPEWASSTDALLTASDRVLPITASFDSLSIKATFGSSLSVGRGR